MIRIDFNPDNLANSLKNEWEAWSQKADAATMEIITLWKDKKKIVSDDFKNGIWGELKKFLMKNVFHGKCAYCETNIEGARQSGDAEHFRPKGGVNYKNIGEDNYIDGTCQDEQGQNINHPGYFWLAYHWENLIPACRYCNSVHGKKNQFPTKRGHIFVKHLNQDEVDHLESSPHLSSTAELYFLQPKDLDKIELPYLLHPYGKDDPRDHIEFDHLGKVRPRKIAGQPSLKGQHSIAVYDLENEELEKRRHTEQQAAYTKFNAAVMYRQMLHDESPAEAKKMAWKEPKIQNIVNGKTEYSAAAIDFINLNL